MNDHQLVKLDSKGLLIGSEFHQVFYIRHKNKKGLSIIAEDKEIVIHKEHLQDFIKELQDIQKVYFED